MPSETRTARRDNTSTLSSRADESELCRTYFAHAGDNALRYGVGFDEVLAHLYATRASRRRRPLPRVRYIDDLVHAVACVADVDLAWWDLTEQHERALMRVCRQWLEPTDAIVFVRRLMTTLRRDDGDSRSLRAFNGTRTMRQWLGDRIIDGMKQQHATELIDDTDAAEHWLAGSVGVAAGHGPRLAQCLLDGHVLEGNVIWRPTPPESGPWDPPVRDHSSGASG